MAKIKKLDIISITDHNTTKQLKVCQTISKSYDLLFIPGVEITVKEQFDVLVYFKDINDAIFFDAILENYLNKNEYDTKYYGEQMLFNEYDDVIGYYPYLLAKPLNLSFNQLIQLLKPYSCILVYAHIDKNDKVYKKINQKNHLDAIEYVRKKPNIKNMIYLNNSDAHQIIDIKEVTDQNQIDLDELTINAFMRYFKHD